MDTSINFRARGQVLGNLWGGGKGYYSSKVIDANTKEELLTMANKMLNDGSLDGGMGFESLIGAILHIDKITEKLIEGKVFVNIETEHEIIGEIDEDDEAVFLN
jgi:hypothetical protein